MTNDSNDIVFSARGLTKVYDMGEVQVHALRGVDIDLYRGELVVFLGASGSGKSTLLNILGGLDQCTSGVVKYCQQDLSQVSEAVLTHFRRHHVGFVFQFYNLIPSLTAEENVAVVTEIADEPTGALDSATGVMVLSALQRVNQELGTTTAIITHNASIAQMADRVIYLTDGQISHIEVNTQKKDASEIVW